MTTLRRELKNKILAILEESYQDNPPSDDASKYNEDVAEKLTDTILEISGISKRQSPSISANSGIDWLVKSGVEEAEIQKVLDKEKLFAEATTSFESAFKVNPWPWKSNRMWEKFAKFVVEWSQKRPSIWKEYVQWREGEGKYKGGMTNTKIRQQPDVFMDASFPSFLAYTAMYQPKRDFVEPDDNGVIRSY